MTDYNKNVRPRNNNNQPTDVHLYMTLRSVTKLDELSGILTSGWIMQVSWIDDNLTWDPISYGNITDIGIDKSSIWSPGMSLLNPATYAESLGTVAAQTFVTSRGEVFWDFGQVIHTSCDIDVTYFPFDVQRCAVEFMPFGIKNKDINLIAHPLSTSLYLENNAWILKSVSAESKILQTQPYAQFYLTLERRYAFYILNLYSPVLILVFLNVMVFIIPADSGERIGYAITCLLSLSVYMTFASQRLPNASKTLPIITFLLMTYIIISTLISIGTIIGLRFHLHDQLHPPPFMINKLFCLSHNMCKRKLKIGELAESEKDDIDVSKEANNQSSWKYFADRFDTFCFITSSACIFLVTFVYFLIVKYY